MTKKVEGTGETLEVSGDELIVTVTAEDLKKALDDLAPIVKDTVVPPVAPKLVDPVPPVGGVLKEGQTIQKAVNMSPVLADLVTKLGKHVDDALFGMYKSLVQAGERDLSVLRVLGELKKSIDLNTQALNKLSSAPVSATPVSQVVDGSVIEKGALQTPGKGAPDPKQARTMVLTGLEYMAKSANSSVAARARMDIIRYESSGQISEDSIRLAMDAYRASHK